MARECFIWDADAFELVSREEIERRRANRPKKAASLSVRKVERGSWVFDRATGELVEKRAYVPQASGPMVITDNLGTQGLWHPAENRRTDSKSEFRQWTKAHGCVEIGNEPIRAQAPRELSRAERAADIKQAMRSHGLDVL